MKLFMILSMLFSFILLVADEGEAPQQAPEDDPVMQAHRFFASDFFNKCWELIDKTDRTPFEDLEMVNLSHASRAHWQFVGNAENWTVGEWQLSRVYSLLNRTEPCLVHAKEALRLCLENDIKGFNRGFAYEAMAKAYYLMGDMEKAKENIELGKAAAKDVPEKEDKEYLLKDLNSIIK